MSLTVTLRSFPGGSPDKVNLQGLIALIKKLQQLAEPLATADGLRQAIEMLVEIGTATGLNSAWIGRLQSLLSDPKSFDTVLSLISYFESLLGSGGVTIESNSPNKRELSIDAQSLAGWLPIVLQILQLIQSLRGKG